MPSARFPCASASAAAAAIPARRSARRRKTSVSRCLPLSRSSPALLRTAQSKDVDRVRNAVHNWGMVQFRNARASLLALALMFRLSAVSAATITFESEPPNTLTNVNPAAPWQEARFQLTPSDSNSAVFGVGYPAQMYGDPTAFFGFAPDNSVTLTASGAFPFNLSSIDLGLTDLGGTPASSTTFTLSGIPYGGGAPSPRCSRIFPRPPPRSLIGQTFSP